MALQRLDPRRWIEPDVRFAEELRLKEELWSRRPRDVFQALPEAAAAQAELREALLRHLLQDHPDHYRREGDSLLIGLNASQHLLTSEEPPLLQTSRWVQDDLCLLQPCGESHCLTAASLCAPSYWRLGDKLGRPLGAIHGPVPDYVRQIGDPMERFFRQLKVEHPVWRANWSIVDSPQLFQPGDECPDDRHRGAIDSSNAGERLYLRVERQTLRRLPRTGAIVFTIRVYIDPLQRVMGEPGVAVGLQAAVLSLSEAEWRYKGMDRFGATLIDYLQAKASAI
jgi:hypothetical protein